MDNIAEVSDESQLLSEDGHESSRASRTSSDEDPEDERPTTNSYSTLLQSLSANVQRGPPQRKKRKINTEDRTEALLQSRTNYLDEQEDFEAPGGDDVEDHLGSDDIAYLDEIEDGA